MEEIKSDTDEMPTFGDLTNLSPEKLQELETVLNSILALPVARETYSQIIHGTPSRMRSHLRETIVVNDSLKSSEKAIHLFEEIRTKFALQNLKIDMKVATFLIVLHLIKANFTQLAQNYQNASRGSRENLLRLLEIAAASVHALAGMIYTSFHKDTNIMPPEPREGHYWQFRRTDHFYVDFYHTNYRRFENYPFGLLNVVGYWAETEIFGGVVLFERVESGSDVQLIPLSSCRTYTNE